MTSTVCAFAVSSLFIFGLSAFPCFTHVSEGHFMLCKEKWKLYIEWSHFIVFNSKLFLIAFYVVTPEPAIWLELLARSVLLLITNIMFIFVQLFFRHYSSFYVQKAICLSSELHMSFASILIERIQRWNKQLPVLQGEVTLLNIHSGFCCKTTKEEDEVWLAFHKTSW